MCSVSAVTIELGSAEAPFLDSAAAEDAVRPMRAWGLLLTLVLTIALTGAAPDASPLVEVARMAVGVGSYALDGDTLYTLQPGIVTAYDAATGGRRWYYRQVTDALYAEEVSHGGVALLSSDPCVSGAPVGTAAVDPGTGREFWHLPGVPASFGTLAVLAEGSWADRCLSVPQGQPLSGEARWTGVVPATGATAWQVSVPRGSIVALDDRASAWAAVRDVHGGLSVVDLRTGVASPPLADLAAGDIRLVADGDLLVVARALPANDADARVWLTAYDRVTLKVRWETTISSTLRGFTAQPCGGYLCFVNERTVALEPTSGAARWSGGASGYLTAGGRLLAGRPVGGTPDAQADVGGVFVRDPRTGQATVTLATWKLLGADPTRLLVGQVGVDETLLAWLDGDTPAPFAALPGRFDSCALAGSTLACRTNVDEVWLLSLRPATMDR